MPLDTKEQTNPGKPQPRDIRARSFTYALRAIKLYQNLQSRRDGAGWILGKQFLRAATSMGANVEEAQAAKSRMDFVHKLGIAEKEARESLYWLRLVAESGIFSGSVLQPLMSETAEISTVTKSIIVSTKGRTRR